MFTLTDATGYQEDHHRLGGLMDHIGDLSLTEGGLVDVDVLDTRTGYLIGAQDLVLLVDEAPGHETYRTKNSKGLAIMELGRLMPGGGLRLSRTALSTNRKEWVSLEIDDGSCVSRYIMPHSPAALADHSYNIVQSGTRLVAIGKPWPSYLWGSR